MYQSYVKFSREILAHSNVYQPDFSVSNFSNWTNIERALKGVQHVNSMKLPFTTKVQMIIKCQICKKVKKNDIQFTVGKRKGIPTLKINIKCALFDDLDLLIRSFFGGPGIL